MNYATTKDGGLFPIEKNDKLYDLIKFIFDYSNENKYNMFGVLKEISSLINNRDFKLEGKSYYNKFNNEFIMSIDTTKDSIVDILVKNGYIVTFSKLRKSKSIYVRNDEFKLIRISDHNLSNYENNDGIIHERFHKQIVSTSGIIDSTKLDPLGIKIPEGFYHL